MAECYGLCSFHYTRSCFKKPYKEGLLIGVGRQPSVEALFKVDVGEDEKGVGVVGDEDGCGGVEDAGAH